MLDSHFVTLLCLCPQDPVTAIEAHHSMHTSGPSTFLQETSGLPADLLYQLVLDASGDLDSVLHNCGVTSSSDNDSPQAAQQAPWHTHAHANGASSALPQQQQPAVQAQQRQLTEEEGWLASLGLVRPSGHMGEPHGQDCDSGPRPQHNGWPAAQEHQDGDNATCSSLHGWTAHNEQVGCEGSFCIGKCVCFCK